MSLKHLSVFSSIFRFAVRDIGKMATPFFLFYTFVPSFIRIDPIIKIYSSEVIVPLREECENVKEMSNIIISYSLFHNISMNYEARNKI